MAVHEGNMTPSSLEIIRTGMIARIWGQVVPPWVRFMIKVTRE